MDLFLENFLEMFIVDRLFQILLRDAVIYVLAEFVR